MTNTRYNSRYNNMNLERKVILELKLVRPKLIRTGNRIAKQKQNLEISCLSNQGKEAEEKSCLSMQPARQDERISVLCRLNICKNVIH